MFFCGRGAKKKMDVFHFDDDEEATPATKRPRPKKFKLWPMVKKGDIVVQRVAVGCELVCAADGGPRFLLCFHSRDGEGLLCDCRFARDVYALSGRSERLQSEGTLHVDDRVLRMQAAALKHSKCGERVRNLDVLLNKTGATGVFVDPRACRLSRLEKV